MAFLHHLLDFVISRPASETSLAVPLSRRPSPGFPPGRCRQKRHLPGTFSFSLQADPPQRPLSPSQPRIPSRKVPTETAFARHLLDSVISRPTSETSLAVPAPDFRPEGADKSGISPSLARHAVCLLHSLPHAFRIYCQAPGNLFVRKKIMQVVSEYVTDFELLLPRQMSITADVELPYKFVVDNPAKLEIGNRYIGNPSRAFFQHERRDFQKAALLSTYRS